MPPATQMTAHENPNHPSIHLTGFRKHRWSVNNPPSDPNVTFAGKTVLVTGANAGLGFEAALKYAQKGCSKLILAVRSTSKGEAAKKSIIEQSKRADTDFITILPVDLSTFSSVQSFISTLEKHVEPTGLDIALLNAGLANPNFITSTHGYEMALQVNVLSTALMAILLLPILRKTATSTSPNKDPPHLTFVNSFGHHEVKREWYSGAPYNNSLLRFVNTASAYDLFKSYCGVKLLGMAVMLRIAAVTTNPDGSPQVIVNSMCPFLCKTSLGRNFNIGFRIAMSINYFFQGRTAEQGGRALVSATVLGRESQGKFWHHDILYPLGEIASDEEEMNKCWVEIRDILEKKGGVSNIEALLRGE